MTDIEQRLRKMPPESAHAGPVIAPRPAMPSTFVAPQRQQQSLSINDILPPVAMSDLPAPSIVHGIEMRGSYSDRGRAFVLVTSPLSLVGGVLGIIAGIAVASVPLLSLAALAWFFSMFALVWFAAFVIYVASSQDGISLVRELLTWRHVQAERRFRHQMIERVYEDRYGHKD